ncbi:hypothetical protein T440DRAFT_443509 [Plenodomus tracheiphilus IPT5]|uniref:Transcription factor domain-containing protein n=1 Tax=Plenodomus tracheiphilus IPT5 TaxID=1408161 RepID=A0A6A7BI25_9PLEO|nr:hypothetical protein T440DRAFT_443509 [Plenodomus tracheiphilus IPT5]
MARKSNYKVRFRHGVYPELDNQATRADIKKYDYFFGSDQTWVKTPVKVDFIDESKRVRDGENQGMESSTKDRKMTSRRVTHSRNTHTRCGLVERRRPRHENSLLHTTGGVSGDGLNDAASTDHSIYPPWHAVADMYHYGSSGPESVSSPGDIAPSPWQDELQLPSQLLWQSTRIEDPTVWPLEFPHETYLLRFWVDEAAAWLDSTSSDGIFKRVVPALASQNSMLLNAILMYSAQHIRRFHANFPANPYMYHERLLQHLIPHLAEKGRIEDEATLVAAMLLRAFEEYDAGTEGQTHLSTHELFQGPRGWLFDTRSLLAQACLMMHVRLEIHHALLGRPSLRINYSDNVLEAPTSLSDDACWENRIIWLTARILQWTEKDNGSISEWYELVAMVDEWELNRPTSFKAITCDRRDSEYPKYYPELWLSSPYHAAANVNLQICRMALAVHNPNGVSGGILTSNPISSMRYEVLKGLKEIVASTICDKHAIFTSSMAAHAIHRFAVILRNNIDRQKMIEFLEEVDNMGLWRTKASIQKIRIASFPKHRVGF